MAKEWDGKTLEITYFRDTGYKILQGANIEEHQIKLDEHRMLSQTIKFSAEVDSIKN
jgi:hypothetical protein